MQTYVEDRLRYQISVGDNVIIAVKDRKYAKLAEGIVKSVDANCVHVTTERGGFSKKAVRDGVCKEVVVID
jgi:hypothetical protein